ncbi:hypothetical protein [Nocardia sp. CC227C]|uniref:hypothetical protein n=1 Tax=Nocardia sp. CC227C TaxID=3044562 RepID=UPI00278BB61E|nr:hypothetical protein [Nocardia sp. CC227C]
MNRLTLFLVTTLFALFSLLIAPVFVLSVLITAVVFAVGVRWFARAAFPARRDRGMWR